MERNMLIASARLGRYALKLEDKGWEVRRTLSYESARTLLYKRWFPESFYATVDLAVPDAIKLWTKRT